MRRSLTIEMEGRKRQAVEILRSNPDDPATQDRALQAWGKELVDAEHRDFLLRSLSIGLEPDPAKRHSLELAMLEEVMGKWRQPPPPENQ